MTHVLIIGGTGMLVEVSRWLAEQEGYKISIVGRNPFPMNRLVDNLNAKTKITPLLVDYTNSTIFRERLNWTIQQNGPIDLVVAWVHSIGENTLNIVKDEVSKDGHKWCLFHIIGSSSDLSEIKKEIAIPENCSYYQIQLGFILEKDHSRWLTHEEISDGVIEAIKNKRERKIIGVIEPWDKKP